MYLSPLTSIKLAICFGHNTLYSSAQKYGNKSTHNPHLVFWSNILLSRTVWTPIAITFSIINSIPNTCRSFAHVTRRLFTYSYACSMPVNFYNFLHSFWVMFYAIRRVDVGHRVHKLNSIIQISARKQGRLR